MGTLMRNTEPHGAFASDGVELKMAKKPTWSFSALQSFDNCAFKHNETRVAKRIVDEWGPEAKEGTEIHERLEKRLLSGTPLTGTMSEYEDICKRIESAAGELHPETKFCLTREMKPTQYKDWANGWFRGVIDVLKVNGDKAWVGDWKTGKVKNEYDQLELFAGLVFIFYPDVKEVKANYIWLKTKELSPTQTYTREDLAKIWGKHIPRAMELEKAFYENNWPTNVTGLCKSFCVINKLGKCPDPRVPKYVAK